MLPLGYSKKKLCDVIGVSRTSVKNFVCKDECKTLVDYGGLSPVEFSNKKFEFIAEHALNLGSLVSRDESFKRKMEYVFEKRLKKNMEVEILLRDMLMVKIDKK